MDNIYYSTKNFYFKKASLVCVMIILWENYAKYTKTETMKSFYTDGILKFVMAYSFSKCLRVDCVENDNYVEIFGHVYAIIGSQTSMNNFLIILFSV